MASIKRIAFFESKEQKTTIAIKIEPEWEDMLSAVAEGFDLERSSIKLFVNKPIVDVNDKPTSVRVLPSSWSEVLDMVELRVAGRSDHLIVQGNATAMLIHPATTAFDAKVNATANQPKDTSSGKRSSVTNPACPSESSQNPKHVKVENNSPGIAHGRVLVKIRLHGPLVWCYTRYLARDEPLRDTINLIDAHLSTRPKSLAVYDGDIPVKPDQTPSEFSLRFERFGNVHNPTRNGVADQQLQAKPENGHKAGGKGWVLVLSCYNGENIEDSEELDEEN